MPPASSAEHLNSPERTPGDPIPAALLNSSEYEVIRELNRGGMGVVYLVRNRRMDRLECLKVVSQDLLKVPGAKERFEREMRSAARVNHPHIVTAYSAPQLEALLAFAMEYVDGIDLARLVRVKGPIPVSNACSYIHQAASALQYAHEKSLVHRDIKPGNLMLAREGNRDVIKILDFGLARATSEGPSDKALTVTGQMLGTPHYIAPEQITNAASADIRADIYSLGCTLYYLLTGAGPFEGKSGLYELLHAQQFESPRPLNELRPDVSQELAAITAKMTAKAPQDRYQQPDDVARAMAPFFSQPIDLLSIGPDRTSAPAPDASLGIVNAETEVSMRARGPESPAAAGTAFSPRAFATPTIVENAAMTDPQPNFRNRMNAPDRPQPDRGRRSVWGRLAVLALLVIAAALWWFEVLDVKTRYATLVLEVNEPNPDVYMDGAEMEVAWSDEGKKAEIRVKTGDHRVEVSKDGFSVAAKDISLKKEGDSQTFKARLIKLPMLAANNATPGPAAAISAASGHNEQPSAAPSATGTPTTTTSPNTAPATAQTPSSTQAPPPTPAQIPPPIPPPTATPTPTQTAQSPSATSLAGFDAQHSVGEERDDNVLKMKIDWCPPGEFTMGSPRSEKDRGTNEEQVRVTLTRGFWLGKYEVTQGQWSQLMATTPWKGQTYIQEGPDFPVTYVTWDDAAAFCAKLTTEEHTSGRLSAGWQYTLPTEAQWEYACRAGTKSAYFFGDDPTPLLEFGWFKANTIDKGEKYAHSVRLKQPNAWGLCDMHGNVFEWCRDRFAAKLKGGPDPFVAAGAPVRVYRGGGWFDTPPFCRSAIRRGEKPAFTGNALGFRAACIKAAGG